MPLQVKYLLPGLDIPQFRGVIHRTSRYEHAMRVETQAHNFHFVALQSVIALARICVPNLSFAIE